MAGGWGGVGMGGGGGVFDCIILYVHMSEYGLVRLLPFVMSVHSQYTLYCSPLLRAISWLV